MAVSPGGGGGGQTGHFVAKRGNFSRLLDFCPNIVSLAQKKMPPPPNFRCAESKKTTVGAWGDGGEALSRAESRPFACFTHTTTNNSTPWGRVCE